MIFADFLRHVCLLDLASLHADCLGLPTIYRLLQARLFFALIISLSPMYADDVIIFSQLRLVYKTA